MFACELRYLWIVTSWAFVRRAPEMCNPILPYFLVSFSVLCESVYVRIDVEIVVTNQLIHVKIKA